MRALTAILLSTLLAASCRSADPDDGNPINLDEWRYVSGPDYEGMAIATEGFWTRLASPRPVGPGPTDAEIEAVEARMEDELRESGIESVPSFEGLIDRLPEFRRYYFAGVNVVHEVAFEPDRLPDDDEPLSPRFKPELEGHRVIMVEFTLLAGEDWLTNYGVVGIEGWDDDQFLALYLPETGTFWLQFELGGEIDNVYH